MAKIPSLSRNLPLIIGLLLVLFGGYLLLAPSSSALKTPIKDQLQAIRMDDMATAYAFTSKAFQQTTSLDAFKRFINAYNGLRNNETVKINDSKIKNGMGFVKATLVARGGFQTAVTYQLVKEHNRWKIESIVLVPNTDEPISSIAATTKPETKVMPVTNSTETNETTSATATDATNASEPAKPAEETPAPGNPGGLSFSDPAYHYSLTYPTGWDFTRANRGITVFYRDDHQVDHPVQFIVQPLEQGDPTAIQSVQQIIEMGEAAINDKASNYNILEDGLLPENANKNERYHGKYVLYSYTLNNEVYKQLQVVFFVSPARAEYVIDFIAPEADFDKTLSTAREIISSFSIS